MGYRASEIYVLPMFIQFIIFLISDEEWTHGSAYIKQVPEQLNHTPVLILIEKQKSFVASFFSILNTWSSYEIFLMLTDLVFF